MITELEKKLDNIRQAISQKKHDDTASSSILTREFIDKIVRRSSEVKNDDSNDVTTHLDDMV